MALTLFPIKINFFVGNTQKRTKVRSTGTTQLTLIRTFFKVHSPSEASIDYEAICRKENILF
jgi:hypothetical protein